MDINAVKMQLERIVADPLFGANSRLSRFLTYIVEETVCGRADRIKGYSIALSVFDRDDTFDPSTDSIVRVEAIRLRSHLATYYATTGKDDPVLIEVPVGNYMPQFRLNPRASDGRWQRWLPIGYMMPAAAAVVLVLGLMFLVRHYLTPENAQASVGIQPASAGLAKEVLVLGKVQIVEQGEVPTRVTRVLRHELATSLSSFQSMRLIVLDDGAESRTPVASSRRLKGRVHRHRDEWHFAFHLIQQPFGDIIWSKEIRLPGQDEPTDAQLQEIATKIVATIAPPLGVLSDFRVAEKTAEPGSPEWANICLQRLLYFWKPLGGPELRNARNCIERILRDNPLSEIAWAAKAFYHLDNERFQLKVAKNTGQEIAKALNAAKKAYDLNPNSVEAVRALYSVQFALGELDEFRFLANRALSLNPRNAHTLADIGRKNAYSGDWVTGIRQIKSAIEQTPNPPDWFLLPLAHNYYRLGQYREALNVIKKVRRGKFCGRYIVRTASLVSLGELDKARLVAKELLLVYPKFETTGNSLLNMWNFEAGLLDRYRTDLAKAGVNMERSNRGGSLS